MYKSDVQTRYNTLEFNYCSLNSDQMNVLQQFIV